jgi:hypothetical protein
MMISKLTQGHRGQRYPRALSCFQMSSWSFTLIWQNSPGKYGPQPSMEVVAHCPDYTLYLLITSHWGELSVQVFRKLFESIQFQVLGGQLSCLLGWCYSVPELGLGLFTQ